MATALSIAAAAFLLTLSLGYRVLGFMRRAGIAKQVRADELPSHFTKTGTLTMGGLFVRRADRLLTLRHCIATSS